MKKVLLLGAAGNIGRDFVKYYLKNSRDEYELILGFHSSRFESDLKSVFFDLSNLDSLKQIMSGIDVVINLAGNPSPKAKFKEVVEPNLIGAYNVFEAARLSGVSRVIFASSVHAIRGYDLGYRVKASDVPKPLNFYGASKVFAEALCNVYSSQYDLSCLAIRIGAYISKNQQKEICASRENFDYVISERDMAQLISKSIAAPPEVKYGILAGISNNSKKSMELKCTKELVGYEPEDDSFKMCGIAKD